jgi:hypothetical protein
MQFDDLNEENAVIYAMKAYDKPNCIMSEFSDDIKKFEYLKRLFKRYEAYGEIRETLVINHLVVLYNVFGPEAATRLLFYNISEKYYTILKTYLLFLNYMPERIKGIGGRDIISSDISVDMKIVDVLRTLR